MCDADTYSYAMKKIVLYVLMLATASAAHAACTITSGDATGYVGVPFSYQITVSGGQASSYGATGLPASLTINTSTGLVSGIPANNNVGTSSVTPSATTSCGTASATLTIRTYR
jgi:hypothetical protein